MGATVQTRFFRNVFMMDDLPVFGYPMKPTEICFREEWRVENCRSRVMREPLPKEFVMDAWNASVGYSLDKSRTHWACREIQISIEDPKYRGKCVRHY